jgi:hypothetical protein
MFVLDAESALTARFGSALGNDRRAHVPHRGRSGYTRESSDESAADPKCLIEQTILKLSHSTSLRDEIRGDKTKSTMRTNKIKTKSMMNTIRYDT